MMIVAAKLRVIWPYGNLGGEKHPREMNGSWASTRFTEPGIVDRGQDAPTPELGTLKLLIRFGDALRCASVWASGRALAKVVAANADPASAHVLARAWLG